MPPRTPAPSGPHINQTQFSPESVNTLQTPRFESPTADHGVSSSNAFHPGLLTTAYGHSQTPTADPSKMEPQARDTEVGRAAARIVQSHINPGRNVADTAKPSANRWVASHMPTPGSAGHKALENDRLLDLGEKFYPNDAHGAALAHASGYDYSSPETAALRRTGGHSDDIRRNYGNRLSEDQIGRYNNFHAQLAEHRAANPDNAGVKEYGKRTQDMTDRMSAPGFGDRVHKAAAELAVTSPQNPWERNVQQAFELRDVEHEHPGAVAEVNSWPTRPTKDGGVKTTKPKDPDNPKRNVTLRPDEGVPNRHGVPAGNPRRGSQFDNMTAHPHELALNQQSGDTIKAGLDIQRGGDPEKYVRTDENRRIKIGTFEGNIENPWGGRQIPGTRQHDAANGVQRKFGDVGDHMAQGWGAHPNEGSHMSSAQFDQHSGGGSRKATVDFRAHDIATGYATPTAIAPGLDIAKTAKSRTAGGQKYDALEEAHGRAADYVNEHHAEHRVGGLPLMPSQIQGTTWWRDRVHTNMEMGGSGKGTGLVHENGGNHAAGEEISGKTSSRNSKPVGQPASPGETAQMGSYFGARDVADKAKKAAAAAAKKK
jgi:hypothetical protein